MTLSLCLNSDFFAQGEPSRVIVLLEGSLQAMNPAIQRKPLNQARDFGYKRKPLEINNVTYDQR